MVWILDLIILDIFGLQTDPVFTSSIRKACPNLGTAYVQNILKYQNPDAWNYKSTILIIINLLIHLIGLFTKIKLTIILCHSVQYLNQKFTLRTPKTYYQMMHKKGIEIMQCPMYCQQSILLYTLTNYLLFQCVVSTSLYR